MNRTGLKASSSLLVLIFWISSWLPASPDPLALTVAAGCIFGLIAAHLGQARARDLGWPAKLTSALALVALISGMFLAVLTWAKGTSAQGAITLFFVVGATGYILMLSAILTPRETSSRWRQGGLPLLVLLSIWSWVSAVAMYSHRGVERLTSAACIVVPDPIAYDRTLTTIWEMRLPEVAAYRTSPNRRYIWDYHAIWIAQIDGQTHHYNWSKKWLRFERLDAVRNPYLPSGCP